MGFDISYHPVDLDLIQRRLLPYVLGYGDDRDLDDLVARVVELAKVRFRAKAWALGVSKRADHIASFDSFFHVWGRPFFIVADDADSVYEAYQRYVAASPETVDGLAREMLGQLDRSLVDSVMPDLTGHLPEDGKLAILKMGRLRILRAATAAFRAGEAIVRDPHMGEHEAVGLLTREIPFSVVDFAADLMPGWMARGYVWPTRLCYTADVSPVGFGLAEPLLEQFRSELPALEFFAEESISENYMIGGFVLPEDVEGCRRNLRTHHDAILAPAQADGWGGSLRTDLRKIDEALSVALRLDVAFVEATEIYSGMEGTLN